MIGVAGVGLVWGWLTAPLVERGRHPWRIVLLVGGAALLQAAEAAWLVGPKSLWLLAGSWVTGFLLHRAVRNALRIRVHERTT